MSQLELSCIVPFCDEGSNVIFTTQALIEELDGFCKYEIVLIDNMSHDHLTIKAGEREYPAYSRNFWWTPKGRINTMFFRKGIVKYLQYDAKLGHWNAKNHGIANSTGKYLFFVDAHTIMKRDSLRKMLTWLRENDGREMPNLLGTAKPWRVGGVHAYINYILDSRSLEYKPQKKTFGYQFCTHQMEPYMDERGVRQLRFPSMPYQVCVMSTCAMMCPRSVLDDLGAWNPEFGIYGGGESYMNWKQSTCGYGHWIHPEAWCWHFADKRGYSWNHSDFVRNSFIAAYVVGGDEYLDQQVKERMAKERPEVITALADDVRTKCRADREFVAGRQIVSFDNYINWWIEHPGVWK